MVGFLVVLALAVTLIYRVYRHHTAVDPYERDEPAVVRLDEKITPLLR
jgi:hypothetical protein